MVRPAGHCSPLAYFFGSSVTTTTAAAPSDATWRPPLGRTLARHLRHREPAVVGLAARHGDRIVEQDLVGHAHAGRDRGADRHVAGMVVGAVADILEHA